MGPEPKALCCLSASDLLTALSKQHFKDYTMRVVHLADENFVIVIGTEIGDAPINEWCADYRGKIFVLSTDIAFNFTRENMQEILAEAKKLTQTILVYLPKANETPRKIIADPNKPYMLALFHVLRGFAPSCTHACMEYSQSVTKQHFLVFGQPASDTDQAKNERIPMLRGPVAVTGGTMHTVDSVTTYKYEPVSAADIESSVAYFTL